MAERPAKNKPVNLALYIGIFALIVLPVIAYTNGLMDKMTAYVGGNPVQSSYQIQILSPEPDDTFAPGGQMLIQWKNPTSSMPPASIYLLREKNEQSKASLMLIARNVQGELYQWIVPEDLSGNFEIKVQNSSGYGQMQGHFTIKAQ